ncbi:FadR/GntR family transcriptional regulator [Cryobacterium sp. W22_MBD10_FK3]|uniref:FadR/GntR family transcriptional regulator n=1 Tax=Cryobacterium sp. W22_MBD10_FK3 TaxID=3240273 RepID=UPI003F93E5DB
MTTLRREPLADQVADALLERIRNGEWELGQKLPGETSLAPQFGVGRSTIREAIRQLAGRGVLATRQGAGVFVSALDASDDWIQVLNSADIASVVEARIAIEVESCALAAERRTPADLRSMRRALAHRGLDQSSVEEHVDSDIDFHRSIVIAAHNTVLAELFEYFVPRSRQAMIELVRLRSEFGSEADQCIHAQILEAISVGDPQSAAALSRDHLLTLKTKLR